LAQAFMAEAQEFSSLKGQLLLDSGELRGSFFHRAVVLICTHDAQGAFGLVLTNPSPNKVGEALVADLPDSIKEMNLYLGGPVQTAALSYLHSDIFLPDANVIPNLNLGHSLEDLVDLGQSFASMQQLRIFAGYAGWTAGQLEGEMKRKAWLTHPASLDLVFQSDTRNLWKEILLKKGGWKYKLLADAPEDLSRN
jgi:putative transcriptional regulator